MKRTKRKAKSHKFGFGDSVFDNEEHIMFSYGPSHSKMVRKDPGRFKYVEKESEECPGECEDCEHYDDCH